MDRQMQTLTQFSRGIRTVRGVMNHRHKEARIWYVNCGSKDHWYRDCPHPKRPNHTPQNQNLGSPQRKVPKGAGRDAPKAPPPAKGDKGGKGKGKKGKDDAKNQNPKGQGKRQGRPGARAALDWENEHPEGPDDDDGHDENPPEENEQEQETPEGANEEDPNDYGWGGEGDEPEEQEPSDNYESMVKTIVTVMQKCAEETTKEQQEKLSLSSLSPEGGGNLY